MLIVNSVFFSALFFLLWLSSALGSNQWDLLSYNNNMLSGPNCNRVIPAPGKIIEIDLDEIFPPLSPEQLDYCCDQKVFTAVILEVSKKRGDDLMFIALLAPHMPGTQPGVDPSRYKQITAPQGWRLYAKTMEFDLVYQIGKMQHAMLKAELDVQFDPGSGVSITGCAPHWALGPLQATVLAGGAELELSSLRFFPVFYVLVWVPLPAEDAWTVVQKEAWPVPISISAMEVDPVRTKRGSFVIQTVKPAGLTRVLNRVPRPRSDYPIVNKIFEMGINLPGSYAMADQFAMFDADWLPGRSYTVLVLSTPLRYDELGGLVTSVVLLYHDQYYGHLDSVHAYDHPDVVVGGVPPQSLVLMLVKTENLVKIDTPALHKSAYDKLSASFCKE